MSPGLGLYFKIKSPGGEKYGGDFIMVHRLASQFFLYAPHATAKKLSAINVVYLKSFKCRVC